MRYWAYLGGKLAIAGACLYGLLRSIEGRFLTLPHLNPLAALDNGDKRILGTLIFMCWYLVAVVVVYLVIWDQRYRCRTCLRRLRMPVETGSWSRMLQFGRPKIEYICPYGHGTLREDELQISGRVTPEWTPHSDDMWEELCASIETKDDSDSR